MSMGDADAKFPAAPAETVPGTGGGHQTPTGGLLGNPYVLEESFSRLDHALTEIISKIQGEGKSVGADSNEDALVRKFLSWRDELTQIRHGQKGVAGKGSDAHAASKQQEGGLFTD
ncbi:hypothetical protein OH76DRAFT_1484513 [Lentinus brumalis]|uniref:Uncharacterized protein n=1 Tax=Lentinus brumalis TaxID=2498619 RepID=A0A371D525_9APHY|nr:hypothetical protein OH76DRAFT_1484513 [Polyporus brumalis]